MSAQQLEAALTRIVDEVELIGNANVRKAPTRMSPILRVARASDMVKTTGFTTAGENVQGNSSWYLTEDGSFIWAGATNRPNPAIAATPVRISDSRPFDPQAKVASGISRIDGLLDGTAV